MLKKPKFKGQNQRERSVFEIVSEEGPMRPKEILYILGQVCLLLEEKKHKRIVQDHIYIHPKNIIVNIDGSIHFSVKLLPFSDREGYFPPESGPTDKNSSGADVYGLGILMIYMATGQEKKTNIDVLISNRCLRTLIADCTAFNPEERFPDTGKLMKAIHEVTGIRKKVSILFKIIICGCLIGFLVISWKKGKLRGSVIGEEAGYMEGYVRGYEQGFADAPGIDIHNVPFDANNGNLSGNFAAKDGAIAVCGEDEIFFLWEKNIYRMNPYTKEKSLLVRGVENYGLNYYNGWLYYSTDEKVFRFNPKRMKEEVFCENHTGFLYIVDGVFYLYDSSGTNYLYRIHPETGKPTQINGAMKYRCLNIVGKKLYYIDLERGNSIYCCDLDGGNLRLVNSNSCERFCIHGNKIYVGIIGDKRDGLGRLKGDIICMDLDGGNLENLTNIPAYYPNVTDSGIFYVAGNRRTLEWMSLDGKTRYTVVSTPTSEFNIAGGWIFYRNEQDNDKMWCVRIDGSGNGKLTE
ncbi:hypothetical protein HMPREF1987_02046 [Peptostreptococcaceae bacterium oral taxon 113 str. W5053]|nr:hypothetical protein HMPREF1987_02046 [Peptostreptococcaceae bacterium oral taxon 113 str. W5053]